MESTPPGSLSFYQLSVGLRIILILTLVGSCAGASSESITDRGVSTNDIQQLGEQITSLEREVRQLRREVRRRR